MIGWLLRTFGAQPAPHQPEVKQAARVQERQFGEWASVLAEVERVQRLAKGQERHIRGKHH